jgi:hypothetical protein
MSSMNLLPDSYIKRQFRDRMNMMCVVILGIIMLIAIIVNWVTKSSFDKARGRYINATVMSTRASGLTGEFFTLQRTKDVMITEAKDAIEMEECIPRSYLLGVITNSLPKTVSLTKVELQTQIPIVQKDKDDLQKNGMIQRKSSAAQPTADDIPEPDPQPVVTVTLEGISVSENDYDVANLIRILKGKGLSKKVTLLYARQKKAKKSEGSMEQQELREFGISMELLNDVDVRELIKSDRQKITPPPSQKSGNTEIEKGNSLVGGTAK